MRAPVFYGKVVSNKIILDNRDRFRGYLATFNDKRIELVLREKRTTRSDYQNKYYHGIVLKMISDKTGDTPEDTHENMKRQFRIQSTAKLKTGEFEEYLESIRRWAAQFLELPIPDPNQVDY